MPRSAHFPFLLNEKTYTAGQRDDVELSSLLKGQKRRALRAIRVELKYTFTLPVSSPPVGDMVFNTDKTQQLLALACAGSAVFSVSSRGSASSLRPQFLGA